MKKGMAASNAAGRRSAGVKELQSREGARPGTNDHDGAAVCTTVHVTAGRDLSESAVDEGGRWLVSGRGRALGTGGPERTCQARAWSPRRSSWTSARVLYTALCDQPNWATGKV